MPVRPHFIPNDQPYSSLEQAAGDDICRTEKSQDIEVGADPGLLEFDVVYGLTIPRGVIPLTADATLSIGTNRTPILLSRWLLNQW